MSKQILASDGEQRRTRVPLHAIREHPQNANVMSEERLRQLAAHIEASGRYPPLVVRPHPEHPGEYQLLDGHQRARVLRDLGHEEADVAIWSCTDDEALQLLVSLNRLTGVDDHGKRRTLLEQLYKQRGRLDVDTLVPVGDAELHALVEELAERTDSAPSVRDEPGEANEASAARMSVTVTVAEREAIETAISAAVAQHGLVGSRRRGRALALLCGLEEAVRD